MQKILSIQIDLENAILTTYKTTELCLKIILGHVDLRDKI